MFAPPKAGSTKAKFPAMNWAYNQGGPLWDVDEGVLMMEDKNLATINAMQTKGGKVTLTNASHRWFAPRYILLNAWFFNGSNRSLNNYYVGSSFQVGAVSLL